MINLQQHVRMSIPLKTQNIAGLFKVNNKKPISKQQKNYKFTEIIKNTVINTKYVTYTIKTNESQSQAKTNLAPCYILIIFLKLSVNVKV